MQLVDQKTLRHNGIIHCIQLGYNGSLLYTDYNWIYVYRILQAFAQIGLSYFDVAYQTLDEILSLEISSLLSSTDLKRYFEQIAAKDKRDSEEKKREQFTFAIQILKVSSHKSVW